MHTSGGLFISVRSIGAKLNFTKPFLTYEQQADRLIHLGLTGDRAKTIERLQSVSYYRLSGYWYPDRQLDPVNPKQKLSEFFPNASIDVVWDRYVFDRRLRLLVMDAIERIEVDARNRLAYLHASKQGPFGYADDLSTLPNLSHLDRSRFLGNHQQTVQQEPRGLRQAFSEKVRSRPQRLAPLDGLRAHEFRGFVYLLSGMRPRDSERLRRSLQDSRCRLSDVAQGSQHDSKHLCPSLPVVESRIEHNAIHAPQRPSLEQAHSDPQ